MYGATIRMPASRSKSSRAFGPDLLGGSAAAAHRGPPAERTARVQVLLPLPLDGAYDYKLPADMTLEPGDWVEVPLGNRREIGLVWGTEGAGNVAEAKLKTVHSTLPVPRLSWVNRRFIDWVAGYTLTPAGEVLRMAMRAPGAFDPPKAALAYRRSDTPLPKELRLTPARVRVLELLADGPPRTPADLAREAGCGSGVIRSLAAAGVLASVPMTPALDTGTPDPDAGGVTLSGDQAEAAAELRAAVDIGGYRAIVLDGVTGSGKTEVYFEAVAETLRQERQALVLLPEIALSTAFLDRFERRFGARPAVWHSDITGRTRRLTWRAVADGSAKVVIGARSALFLPYADLGLIVVDEEHDPGYKQEDGVTYHARDMAVVRARLGGFPVCLVSATPALETLVNIEHGRYQRLSLSARHGGAALPQIGLVDLRRDPPPRQSWLSPPVRAALGEALADGEQALLFLNRRGYAPLTLCRTCGYPLECPNCTAWLVEHRYFWRLQCHHCGHSEPKPEIFPSCGDRDSLNPCGPGVERIEEETRGLFPEARIEVLASDTVARPAELQAALQRIREGAVDIVIGTQIIAKGHHFPMLTLVTVIDADIGLEGGDLRAGERTFQLLQQVAGRAGRGSRPGQVMVQTYRPDHPVIAALAAGDRDTFMAAEMHAREQGGMPPFTRLAALILSGPEEGEVDAVARELSRARPNVEGVRILGPAPAPLAVLRGRHRRRFLVNAPKDVAIQQVIAAWLQPIKPPNSVRVQVDIDPYSFM